MNAFMEPKIILKRVYDPPDPADGTRVLVDRLWPRGVAKRDARIDGWARDLAPSAALRRWFRHDSARWPGFRDAYRAELAQAPAALRRLLASCARGPVTLVYAARDRQHNHAVVLREVLLAEWQAWHEPNDPASPVCYAPKSAPGPNAPSGNGDA